MFFHKDFHLMYMHICSVNLYFLLQLFASKHNLQKKMCCEKIILYHCDEKMKYVYYNCIPELFMLLFKNYDNK